MAGGRCHAAVSLGPGNLRAAQLPQHSQGPILSTGLWDGNREAPRAAAPCRGSGALQQVLGSHHNPRDCTWARRGRGALLTPLSFRLLLPWHKSSCVTWPPASCHAKGTRGAVPSSKALQSWVQRSCRDGFQPDFVTAPCPAEDVDVPRKV